MATVKITAMENFLFQRIGNCFFILAVLLSGFSFAEGAFGRVFESAESGVDAAGRRHFRHFRRPQVAVAGNHQSPTRDAAEAAAGRHAAQEAQ